jgi:hypothetical protein
VKYHEECIKFCSEGTAVKMKAELKRYYKGTAYRSILEGTICIYDCMI